ncbi:unnamed protein product [Colias eurytheme]|nr:unnamed protein product [Colias eurytheme]
MSKNSYELVAPDGGYGYFILFAVVLNMSVLNSYSNCYGILYQDFFTELHMGSTDITSINGVSGMCAALAGFMTAPLLKILSKRQTALLATFLFNCGLFCTAFAKSKIAFFFFQSLIQSSGIGLIFNIAASIINDYFVEKRLLANSIFQTLSALVSLLTPQILKWCIEVFGYRSALLWATAFSIHAFVGVTLYQPVALHMKKVEISPKENEMKLLLQETIEASAKTNNGDTKEDNENIESNGDKKINTRKSLTALIGSVVNLQLLKSFVLSINCLVPTVCVAAEMTYVLMIPQALHSYGWDDSDIAWAVSLLSFGDLIMRMSLILLNKWLKKLGSRELYLFGIILGVASRIGMLLSENKTIILSFITLMGIARCIFLVVVILVISESVAPEHFTSAFGMFMMTSGIFNLTLGPALGLIRDYTGSYNLTFSITTAILGIFGVIWAVFIILIRRKKSTEKSLDKNCN